MNRQNSITTKILTLVVLLTPLLLVACDGSDDKKEDDSRPDAFRLKDQSGVGLDQYIVSDAILVSGINAAAAISVVGGEYSINDGDFTSAAGEVNQDNEVRVRVLSSKNLSVKTELTLTIGGVSDIFTVTTITAGLNARDGFKSVVFSWPPVEGISEYRLLEKPLANEQFQPLGSNLGSGNTSFTYDLAVHKHDWQNSEYKLEACTEEACSPTGEISIYKHMQKAIGYIKAANTEENDQFSVLAVSADGETIAVGAAREDSGLAGIDPDGADNSLIDSGAVYIYVKEDDAWQFQSYLKSPTPGEGDAFGSSLSLNADGSVLAIGVPNDDSGDFLIDGDQADGSAVDSGAVYIYRRFGETWFAQNYLKASNGAAGDGFGKHVAISDLGSTLVVASPTANTGTVNAGAIYVYASEGDSWVEQQVIPSAATVEESFGSSLTISNNGNRIAVGAPQFDASTDASAVTGKAYVFDFDGAQGLWVMSAELSASIASHNMLFALDLDLSSDGNTLVIGAPGEASKASAVDGEQSDTSQVNTGAAYLFNFIDGAWAQGAYLKASNSDADDLFGSSVAVNLAGDNVVVGAPGESSTASALHGNPDNNAAAKAGAVYAFEKTGEQWVQLSYVKAPNSEGGDAFGSVVDTDASGNTLVVAAPGEDSSASLLSGSQSSNDAVESGAVYLY